MAPGKLLDKTEIKKNVFHLVEGFAFQTVVENIHLVEHFQISICAPEPVFGWVGGIDNG